VVATELWPSVAWNEVYRGTAIKSMRSVRMAEPMWADAINDSRPLSGTPEDNADPAVVQGLSAPGPKDHLLRFCGSAPAD
jgi:hypothetical protein